MEKNRKKSFVFMDRQSCSLYGDETDVTTMVAKAGSGSFVVEVKAAAKLLKLYHFRFRCF